jgi:SAM-dependent methyltransferase
MKAYDQLVGNYGNVRGSHGDIAALFEEFNLGKKEDSTLDLGAGSLRETSSVAARSGFFVAADLSTEMLKDAPSLIANQVCCDFNGPLPFANSTFSHVLMISSFHHARSKAALLHEIFRVLAEGGLFIAVTNSRSQILSRWTYNFFAGLAEKNAARFLNSDEADGLFAEVGFDLNVRPLHRSSIPVDVSFVRKLETRIFDSAFFLIPDLDWHEGLERMRVAVEAGVTATYNRDRILLIARKASNAGDCPR